MEAAREPIEQASRANEISATVSETNVVRGKRTRRAPKWDDGVVYFTTAFALGRALQDERKSVPEIRLHCDELPPEP